MKKILLLLIVSAITAPVLAQKNETNSQVSNPTNDLTPPPPPPPPPLPPPPPSQPARFSPPRIVKDGINFKIKDNNGNPIVEVYKNKKMIEKISMDKWEANKSYYEKKYGMLPPPPPPPPPAPPVPPAQENE